MFVSGQRHYGGIIWTNHALERLGQRGLSQEMAWQAFRYPEKTAKGSAADSFEYSRQFSHSIVSVIAKQNEKKEWIILSCWINPPLAGTRDARDKEAYKKYKNANEFIKFLLTIKKQLGF